MDEHFKVTILKSDGTKSPFDRNKLLQALNNSGATPEQSNQITQKVEQQLYDGIPSKKIYQLAYGLLKKASSRSAGRYKLKKAIQELGPSGYPFENFVGRLFESFDYKVDIGVQMEGKCVSHEVDILAKKPGELVIVECKFHSDHRAKTNVQVPLYIHSRFKDIESKWMEKNSAKKDRIRGFVVTNTRFTVDAMNYAECENLGMISWDYPQGNGLKFYIDQSGLHPLTSLNSLTKTEKQRLLEKGIVLCRELKFGLLEELGIDKAKINKVLSEATLLIT